MLYLELLYHSLELIQAQYLHYVLIQVAPFWLLPRYMETILIFSVSCLLAHAVDLTIEAINGVLLMCIFTSCIAELQQLLVLPILLTIFFHFNPPLPIANVYGFLPLFHVLYLTDHPRHLF